MMLHVMRIRFVLEAQCRSKSAPCTASGAAKHLSPIVAVVGVRGERPAARVRLHRPDALVPVAVADEVDSPVAAPERHQVAAAAVGQSLAVGAIGVDRPDVGLAMWFGAPI